MTERVPPGRSSGREPNRPRRGSTGKSGTRQPRRPAKTAKATKSTASSAKTAASRKAGKTRNAGNAKAARNRPRRRTRPAPPPPRQPKPRATRKRRPVRLFRLADPRKRIKVLMVAGCVLLSLFAGRLVQLQGLDASAYAVTASKINRTEVVLSADRGDIVDRNGAPLAKAVDAYDVFVDQTAVKNPAAYALQLETLLDQDASALQEKLTGEDPFVYLAKGVSGSTWRKIQALPLAGLGAKDTDVRAYPAGGVGGSLVGFIGADGEPLAGLELSKNSLLAGQDGLEVYRRSAGGQRIPTGPVAREEPVPGQGLRLTVDRDIQWYAEQALADAVKSARADSGAAVVLKLEPDSHEIVALASVPSVDPNDPDETDAPDRGSKAVEEAYEPGSVFKPLTMAAILEEGLASPSTVLSVPDNIRRSGETIRDHYGHPEEQMTLAGIMAKSSNVGTLLATEMLDTETYREYLADFGLGEPTGIGLPAETGGRLPAEMSDLTRDNVSFGQGVSVNAVQMASAYATIANGGVRIDPTLVAATVGPDGEETPVEPSEPDRVVSEETAAQVTSMMEAVMGPGGTGEKVAEELEGYRSAGKTGTGQRIDPECGCYSQYNSSFMGFAPADDPEYVVVVSVLNPRKGNSGSGLAGPAFADIMRFALEREGVRPSPEEAPRLPLFADEIGADDEPSD